ncbi:MAG: copper amine oxidase N-terminal domain-containing protein [Clostridiales bacterium]|jgi:hypothetical protein|nr:copper amine oxidase N-terminal domain-containing protein [Clostridiales bacterium]
MKKAKKIFALILCIALTLSLNVSVYADGNGREPNYWAYYYEVDSRGNEIGRINFTAKDFDITQPLKISCPDGKVLTMTGLEGYTANVNNRSAWYTKALNNNLFFERYNLDDWLAMAQNERVMFIYWKVQEVVSTAENASPVTQKGTYTILSYPVPTGYVAYGKEQITFPCEGKLTDSVGMKFYVQKIGTAPAPTEMKVNLVVKGEKIQLVKPVLNLSDRTFYPFRECMGYLGAEVGWQAGTRTASGLLSGKSVYFTIDENTYMANGKSIKMDDGVTAFIYNDSTYIPIRYAAEALGYSVSWDAATSTITLK